MKSRALELIKSQTSKDASILFAGNFVSSLLAIVFTVLIARFLGPERYGIAAAFMSFVAIVSSIGDLGFGASLFRFTSELFGDPKRARELESITKTVFTFRLLGSLAIVLVLVVTSPIISKEIFREENYLITIYAALAVLSYLLIDYQIHYFQAKRNFIYASSFLISSNLIRVALISSAFYLGNNALLTVAFVFAVSPLLAYLLSLPATGIRVGLPSNWREISRKVIPFSGWMGANRAVSAIGGRIDVLIILQILTAYDVGVFAAAKQLLFGIPLFIGSFATVLAPRYATLKGRKLFIYFKKTILLSIMISLGILIGSFFAPLITLLFGEEYAASVSIFRWLMIAYVPFALSTPAVNVLIYSFGKPNIITVISVVSLPIIIGMNIYLSPLIGVYAPVVAIAVINTLTLLITYYLSLNKFFEITS